MQKASVLLLLESVGIFPNFSTLLEKGNCNRTMAEEKLGANNKVKLITFSLYGKPSIPHTTHLLVLMIMVSVGKWISLYACSSFLSFSPPSKSHREYATISISNLICKARYLTGPLEVLFLFIGVSSIYFPSKRLSRMFKLVLYCRILLTSKEPISWILGTNFNAWKLHLHLKLCKDKQQNKIVYSKIPFSRMQCLYFLFHRR